jgi:hypothetical protein
MSNDLFECDRGRPLARIDRAGLLWLLNTALACSHCPRTPGRLRRGRAFGRPIGGGRANQAGCHHGNWRMAIGVISVCPVANAGRSAFHPDIRIPSGFCGPLLLRRIAFVSLTVLAAPRTRSAAQSVPASRWRCDSVR